MQHTVVNYVEMRLSGFYWRWPPPPRDRTGEVYEVIEKKRASFAFFIIIATKASQLVFCRHATELVAALVGLKSHEVASMYLHLLCVVTTM